MDRLSTRRRNSWRRRWASRASGITSRDAQRQHHRVSGTGQTKTAHRPARTTRRKPSQIPAAVALCPSRQIVLQTRAAMRRWFFHVAVLHQIYHNETASRLAAWCPASGMSSPTTRCLRGSQQDSQNGPRRMACRDGTRPVSNPGGRRLICLPSATVCLNPAAATSPPMSASSIDPGLASL